MKKSFFVMAIIVSALCDGNCWAKETTSTRTCPPGLFCTRNGTYNAADGDIPEYMFGPSEQVLPGWGMWSDMGLCDRPDNGSICRYVSTDYDEIWVSTWFGFYTVKNDNISYVSSGDPLYPGVFACPGTYPHSDSGARNVLQCYRTNASGQKEYYKTSNNTQSGYNTDDANATLTNLQSAMEQAKAAEQNLQSAMERAKTAEQNLQKILNESNNITATSGNNSATANNLNPATINKIDAQARKSRTTDSHHVIRKGGSPNNPISKSGSLVR